MLGSSKPNNSVITVIPQPGVRMRWYERPQQNVDTVVFVHGILGHHVKTWGKFPKFLAEDDDLPRLDILLWGYRTGYLKRHHELHLEGGHLVTTLEGLIRPENDIVLVGHSMGGLIILKGLIDRMIGGFAQTAPCHAVTRISLIATPLNGVWLAGLARRWLALPLRLLGTLHKHLHALARGDFVDKLMTEVRRRIYQPAAENAHHRKIPIQIIAATRDRALDQENRDFALAPYQDPPPRQLDETHGSVKLPPHTGDLRYKLLFNDLQLGFARTFKRLSMAAANLATTEDARRLALNEMLKRYGKIIRRRVRDKVGPIELHQQAEADVLLLLALYGAIYPLPPYILVDQAIDALALRHPEWR
jgi:pimeloyl-ACP methyl ester carboxylesterase